MKYNTLIEMRDDVGNAIREKDGTSGLIPVQNFGDRIRAIPQSGGGWTRPKERPAVKEDSDVNNNEIYMLFGVENGAPNDMAFNITALGGYAVDWGDGTVENYSSGVTSAHQFNYATLAAAPDSNGVKWVYIKFIAANANEPMLGIVDVTHNVRPSWRPAAAATALYFPQVHEIYAKLPQLATWTFATTHYTRLSNVEIVRLYGTNGITNLSYFMTYGSSLRQLRMDCSKCTNFTNFLNACSVYNEPVEINKPSGSAAFAGFMTNCYGFNSPITINCPAAQDVNLSGFLSGCAAFNSELQINVASLNTLASFMNACAAYAGEVDLSAIGPGTNHVSFANGCVKIRSIKLDAGVVTSPPNTLSGLASLRKLRLLNMNAVTTTLNITGTSLLAAAIEQVFNDLYDRTGITAGTITITNVFGAAALTSAQRLIATSKNWNIVG